MAEINLPFDLIPVSSLVDENTKKVYEVAARKATKKDMESHQSCLTESLEEWKKVDARAREYESFDWLRFHVEQPRSEIYCVYRTDNNDIVGLAAVEEMDGFLFAHLIEAAAQYHPAFGQRCIKGGGNNLFGLVCFISKTRGFHGEYCFNAKTKLVPYYQNIIGARLIGRNNRMVIDEVVASNLIGGMQDMIRNTPSNVFER